MSNYLAKLKNIESEKNSENTPAPELTKPPKDTSVSFVSAIQGGK